MTTIKGNLILTKDRIFDGDLKVEGNILGKGGRKYNLIVTRNINAGNIDAWNINAGDINAWNIDAGDIDAGNINAGNINAGNIDAWNINAGDINAGNIDAWNIDAGDIDAGNIDYYAVCFAYDSIKCESIKGRRENCKHFALDGKIEIKKEKTK